ncbi:MAG: zinc ribbon domain-containing protein [Planctomycetes bacterium]|nr:zinc ribbon domain-containing protein [Planctomycetota bacterium]
MPTYQYECKKCGHSFEQFQLIKAATLEKCPKCGFKGLKRLIGSGGALIFKGSGFYINDYCRPKSQGAKAKTRLKSSENSTKKDRQTNNKDYNSSHNKK